MDFSFQRRGSTSERLRPGPSYKHQVTFHYEITNHQSRMQKLSNAFKVYRLTVLTLVCLVVGIALGLLCRRFSESWTERQFMYVEMPGELYLRFLKLMIIPLLVSNVILSFGSIQGKLSSHLGKVAGLLYLVSNILAITAAIVVAVLLSPGKMHCQHKLDSPKNTNQIQDHHYFNECHDSIKRYREYHPMFYHTEHSDQSREAELASLFVSSKSAADNRQQVENSTVILVKNSTVLSITTNNSGATTVIESSNQEGTGGSVEDYKDYEVEGENYDNPPGEFVVRETANGVTDQKEVHRVGLSTKLPIDVLLDVLRNLIPDSLVAAAMQRTRTRLFAPKEVIINRNGSTNPAPSQWPMGHEMVDQANVIGLLAISVLVGVVLSHMEEASRPMLDLCACVSELSLRIGMIAIHLSPLCIMFLLIGQVARSRNLGTIAGELLMYCVTVFVGLIIHGFIILPLIYYLVTRRSPITFLLSMVESLVAAFATSSSSAAMALMLNSLQDMGLNPVIVRAFGPLGFVFNMNGTAIYEVIGAIFIAQTLGVSLPMTSLLLVGLGAAVASLSTSGVPSSGMMTIVIVLNTINLPVLQLSLIYVVDFVVDRFRTVVNVWSGALICGLIDHICPEHWFEEEMKPEKYQELMKFRGSRSSLGYRRSLCPEEAPKPQIISVTITPPPDTIGNSV